MAEESNWDRLSTLETFGVATEKGSVDSVFNTQLAATGKRIVPKNAPELATTLAASSGSTEELGRRWQEELLAINNGALKETIQAKLGPQRDMLRQTALAGLDVATKSGDAAVAQQLATQAVAADKALENASTPDAFRQITQSAGDMFIANNPRVLENNTAGAIADVSDQVSDKISFNQLQDALIDTESEAGVGSTLGHFAVSILGGPAVSAAVGVRASKAFGIETDIVGGYKAIIDNTRIALSNMDEKDRKAAYYRFYKMLKHSLPDATVAQVLKDIKLATAGELRVAQVADFASVVDVVAVGKGLTNAFKDARTANQIQSIAGNKGLGKVVAATAENPEATGKNPIGLTREESIAASTSFDLENNLPGGLRGASAEAQQAIRSRTEKLLQDLQATVSTTGKTNEELSDLIKRTKDELVNTNDKSVHSVDIVSESEAGIGSVIYRQSDSGVPFTTKEAAHAKYGPDAVVVPAKSGQGFVVTEDAVKALEAKIASLEAKLADTRVGKPHIRLKSKQEPQFSLAAEFGTARMLSGATKVVNKAVSQLTKLQKTAQKQGATDLVNELEDILQSVDDIYGEADILGGMENAVKQAKFGNKVESFLAEADAYAQYFPAVEKASKKAAKPTRQLDNAGGVTRASAAVDKGLQTTLDDLANQLGITDEVQIITKADLEVDDLLELEEMDVATKQRLLDKLNNTAEGVYLSKHISGTGKAVIVLNKGAIKTKDDLITAVHEFMHHFDHSVLKNADAAERTMLVAEFNKWIRKHKPDDIQEVGSFTDFFNSFRVRPTIDGQKAWEQFLSDPKTREWLTSFEEFWAEQATKAMFRITEPKGALEKFFAKVAAGYTAVVYKTMARFGKDYGAPEQFVESYLKGRIEKVKAMDADAEEIFRTNFESLLFPETSIQASLVMDDVSELARLQDELAAMKSARASLSEGWVVKQERNVALKLTDDLKYSDEDIDSALFLAIDPKHGASELAVETRVVGVFQEARVRRLLGDYLKEAVAPLKGVDMARLVKILQDGDGSYVGREFGMEYDVGQLTSLLADHSKESADRIIEAYYRIRTTRNVLHNIRDNVMAKSLTQQGWSEINMGAIRAPGKMSGDFSTVVGKRVFDVTTGKSVLVDDDMAAKWAATDRRVVTLMQPTDAMAGEGRFYKTYVVKSSDVKSDVITSVLPYREGEFSRIYTDQYFITKNVRTTVDEEDVLRNLNIHTASSKSDADKFVNGMNSLIKAAKNGVVSSTQVEQALGKFAKDADGLANDLNAGKFADTDSFSWHFNRSEEDFIRNMADHASQSGNVFLGNRGSGRLTSINDEDAVNTLSPLDSIAAEVTNTARVASITEWRDSHIRRWYNTFKDIIDPRYLHDDPVKTFYSVKPENFFSDSRKRFAVRTHNYITQQLGARTSEERFWEGASRAFTERFFQGEGKMQVVGAKLRNAEVLQFFRTINFHTMLGALNPSQLYVQANGMSTAVILSPLHGLAAAKSSGLYRIALMSDNPEVWKATAGMDKLASLGMGTIDEFVETVKLIRRSGLIDGINSTSLYNIEDGAHNIFNKLSRRTQETSAFFFNRGEEFSRLTAFDVARREWKKANPDKDWTSDVALRDIMVRTDNLTQNMTKANETILQRGVLSLPFQFLQYNIKIGANLVGAFTSKGKYRGFSKMDASKIFMGHLVLYGLANNGLGTTLESVFGNAMTEANLSEEQRHYFAQGVIAGVINSVSKWATGNDLQLAVGKRLSTFDWYADMVKSIFMEEKSFAQVALGASYGTMRNFGVFVDTVKLWKRDPDVTTNDIINGLSNVALQQVTTLRNLEKVYIAYNLRQHISNKAGAGVSSSNDLELIAQALGMPAAEIADNNKVETMRKEHFTVLKNIAKSLNKLQVDATIALNKGDRKKFDDLTATINGIMATMPLGDYQFVYKELTEKVYPFDTSLEKNLAKYWDLKVHDLGEPVITNREIRDNKVVSGQIPKEVVEVKR